MNYKTINVSFNNSVCLLRFNRPHDNNTINQCLVDECIDVLLECEDHISIIVFEGLRDVFCFGADFNELYNDKNVIRNNKISESLYELWEKMSSGPYIIVSHVRGVTNAGGMGFVAASDIVLAATDATFSLSELLFGVYPACVLPFLMRRIGYQKANYLTLMTKPISSEIAKDWGLIDDCGADSAGLLRRHLLRLKYLPKPAIGKYKNYMKDINASVSESKILAINENKEMFSNLDNIDKIFRFIDEGKYPWQS